MTARRRRRARATVMRQKSSVCVSSIGVGLVIMRPPSSWSGQLAMPSPIPHRSKRIEASIAPSGVSQVDVLARAVGHRDVGPPAVAVDRHLLDLRDVAGAVDERHVEGVDAVLHDHLRVGLDAPAVVATRGRSRTGSRPPGRAAAAAATWAAAGLVVPHDDAAVPLLHRPHLEAKVLLAGLLAVRDQGVAPLPVPVPAVPGAHELLALDVPPHAQVGPEVEAVRRRTRAPRPRPSARARAPCRSS